MYQEMNAGESLTITCGACDCEFKLQFEPKAEDMTFKEKRGIKPVAFRYCPFCSHFGEDFHIEQ
jgi:hypothetical protein